MLYLCGIEKTRGEGKEFNHRDTKIAERKRGKHHFAENDESFETLHYSAAKPQPKAKELTQKFSHEQTDRKGEVAKGG